MRGADWLEDILKNSKKPSARHWGVNLLRVACCSQDNIRVSKYGLTKGNHQLPYRLHGKYTVLNNRGIHPYFCAIYLTGNHCGGKWYIMQ